MAPEVEGDGLCERYSRRCHGGGTNRRASETTLPNPTRNALRDRWVPPSSRHRPVNGAMRQEGRDWIAALRRGAQTGASL